MGLFSLFLTFPFVFTLDKLPTSSSIYEPLVFPRGNALVALLIVGSLSAVQNILVQISLSLTSALVVSVLALLTIPGSMLADYICRGQAPSTWDIFGSFTIIIGVLILTMSPKKKLQSSSKAKPADEETPSVNFLTDSLTAWSIND